MRIRRSFVPFKGVERFGGALVCEFNTMIITNLFLALLFQLDFSIQNLNFRLSQENTL